LHQEHLLHCHRGWRGRLPLMSLLLGTLLLLNTPVTSASVVRHLHISIDLTILQHKKRVYIILHDIE
jgi:hypothetical protein